MNKVTTWLKTQWNNDKIGTTVALTTVAMTVAKIGVSVATIRSKNAYARQINNKFKN